MKGKSDGSAFINVKQTPFKPHIGQNPSKLMRQIKEAPTIDELMTAEAAYTAVKAASVGITEMKEKEAQEKIFRVMDGLPKDVARKVFKRFKYEAKNERKEKLLKIGLLAAEEKDLTKKILNHEKGLDLTRRLKKWQADGLVLQRPVGCASHRLFEALHKGMVFAVVHHNTMDKLSPNVTLPQFFVVEHNWSGAFDKSEGIAEGEFRLPYDETCFEFLISGHRVCVLIDNEKMGIYVEVDKEWVVPQNMYSFGDNGWKPEEGPNIPKLKDEYRPLLELVTRQIRAVSIALEAEVAESDVVRAPYKLNHEREKSGKLPLFDYHVVKLARRVHPAALPDDHVGGERRSPRMHFVRGHWKHYTNHKTWTKWFLRGDPDLGFIDKEYRL